MPESAGERMTEEWASHSRSSESLSSARRARGLVVALMARAMRDIAYINSIETEACFYPIIYAPVIQGSKVGKLKIYSNNKLIGTVDIIAPESVTVWQTTK